MRVAAKVCVVVAATLALVAGCGGGTQDAPADEAGPQTLRVTTASTDLGALPLFVAQVRGLFAQQNLTVEISSAAASTITALLSSDGTDLVQNSNGVAIPQTLKGQPTVVAYGMASDNPRTELWSESVATMTEAAALPDCRLATIAPGGASYGYAVYWKERFGLKFEIIVAQSYDVIVAGVKSGTYTTGVVPRSTVGTVPDGMKILIQQDTPDYPGFPNGRNAVIAGLLGLKSNLADKREAMVRFGRAMLEAQRIVDSGNPDDLVADVRQSEIFKAIPPETLLKQVVAVKTLIWKDPEYGTPGYISPTTWTNSIRKYTYWGIEGFSPDDPALAYDKIVDMTFYTEAEKP